MDSVEKIVKEMRRSCIATSIVGAKVVVRFSDRLEALMKEPVASIATHEAIAKYGYTQSIVVYGEPLPQGTTLYTAPPSSLEDELADALRRVSAYVPMQRIACNGLKCREPWCESCNDDETVEGALEDASTDLTILRKVLAKYDAMRKNNNG